MTPDNFSRLLESGYNHIPVVRELFADLDTPLSCYIKVARGSFSYLLESAGQGGEKWARYSVVGLPSTRGIATTSLREWGNNKIFSEIRFLLLSRLNRNIIIRNFRTCQFIQGG